jgi:TonB family protein
MFGENQGAFIMSIGSQNRQQVVLPDKGEDFSVAMQVGFGGEREQKYMKVGFCAALYLVLLLVWLPGFSFGDGLVFVADNQPKPQRRKVLKPPAEKPLEMVRTKERQARKVPMPDLTPEAPEPVVVKEVMPDPNPIDSEDWEIGIPDAPPERSAAQIAMVGAAGVEPPVFTKRVPPEYPQKGVEIRLQGYVILQAILRKSGAIDDIQVLRGLGQGKFGFEDEAIASLQQWQFLPGKVNGRPADVRMNLRVDFILN